jgi:hypothetical protein
MKTMTRMLAAATLLATTLGMGGPAQAATDKMMMMEVWVNQDEVGGFSFTELSRGLPVMMMMKDGKMVLVPIWINPDQVGGFSFDDFAKGVPVMMKSVMKDGKMMMVPIWSNPDQAGGFSFDDFAKHQIHK